MKITINSRCAVRDCERVGTPIALTLPECQRLCKFHREEALNWKKAGDGYINWVEEKIDPERLSQPD